MVCGSLSILGGVLSASVAAFGEIALSYLTCLQNKICFTLQNMGFRKTGMISKDLRCIIGEKIGKRVKNVCLSNTFTLNISNSQYYEFTF